MGATLRKLDKWTDPILDRKSSSILGGTLTMFLGGLVFAYVAVTMVDIINSSNLATQSTVKTFPGNSADAFTLPQMTCIAAGGCWLRPMASAGDGGAVPNCYYYAENEDISVANRAFYYLTDPIDALTVVWTACSANVKTNFGLSYDFTYLDDEVCLIF